MAQGLQGKAVLVTFTDVAAEDEADFNNWYNREHIDDLLKLPGFRRGRRYGSAGEAPRFLAIYEVDEVEVLAQPVYLDLLASQSPWSRRIIARFTSHERMCCRITVDAARGLGGALGLLRIAGYGDAAPLRRRLSALLAEAVQRFDLHGAFFAENDLYVLNAPVRLRQVPFAEAREPGALAVIEAAEPEAAEAALRSLAADLGGAAGIGMGQVRSTRLYRLLYANQART